MTNLEHLIENGILLLDNGASYEQWHDTILESENWSNIRITLAELWEICQYVVFRYKPNILDYKAKLLHDKSAEERLKLIMKTGEFDFLKDMEPDKLWKLMFAVNFILPPAEKIGRWIVAKYPLYTCSECGGTFQDVGYGFDYCPNCGARMEEDE